ncbi:MAG: YfhO family protein [Faecousia sp.]
MKLSEKSGWKWSIKNHLLAFMIPCFGMLMVMLVNGYHPFGQMSMLYSDNYHQYYPFFVAFRKALRSGESLLYSWDVGMGVDYLGLIAYYLGSPLNLLSVLVPESQVLNYFSLLMPIKLGLAGLFFSIFLKRIFDRDDFSIALFGGFYGLCAWALGYQWNVMWLDTFALLPLVALGMVSLLRDKKFILYTVTLTLSVLSNYYIGLFTCFFVFLSFFCYEICCPRGWKRFFADFFRIGVFSVLAIGMTTMLSLTSLAALQTTQSSVNKFPTGFRLNIASSHDLKGLLDAMRQVAGNMGGGIEPSFKEGLPNLYCGIASILLGFLFLMTGEVKLREKLCCMFLLLFFNVSFIIRQLDYIWHGFHFTNMIPYRFSFLYSFVLLYMAYRAWTLRRKFDWLQILTAGLLTGAILCCCKDVLKTSAVSLFGTTVELPIYMIYNVAFFALYFVILLLGSRKPRQREDSPEEILRVRKLVRRRRTGTRRALWAVMALELAATLTAFGFYFPGTSVTDYPRGTEQAASMIRYMYEREKDTLFFRAETTHSQTLNDGALNGYSGISTFTSSANVHITEFMRALGYGAKNTYNRYCFEESSPVANLFLNLKYMIDRDGRDRNSSCFEEVHHYGSVYLYRNTAYLPLGFLTEPQLAQVDFLASDGTFQFQNELFRAATGLLGDVWHTIEPEFRDIYGTGTEVTDQSDSGFCRYSNPAAGSNVIYSFVADRDGFACVHLDLPMRNDFYVSVNGNELYRETISLPQMLAVSDVQAGDVIDIRIQCRADESGTATVNVAIMDNDLFRLGYEILNSSVMTLTSFSNTLVEGTINCNRDGLLYTSIPQNGNWIAEVDGQEQEAILVGECMIGLELSQGAHTLRFVYRNNAFRLGMLITGICAGVFLLLVVIFYRPRKKQPEQAEPEPTPAEPEYLPQAENEMPPLLPQEAEPARQEEPFVLEELTRPVREEAAEQPGDESPAGEAPDEPDKAPPEEKTEPDSQTE